MRWQQKTVTLLRSGEEARESWQVWVAPEHVSELAGRAAARRVRVPTGTAALNLFRISRGIPQFGVDIRERDLPQETGQTRALNFTKGCYLGQEIVERIRSRGAVHRQFTAFAVEGTLPEPGAKILAGEKTKKKSARSRAARFCLCPAEIARSHSVICDARPREKICARARRS